MSAPLVFMDTETTGLSLDDEIWEFAAIRRDVNDDGEVTEREYHIFIDHDRALCGQLPLSFRTDHYNRYRDHLAYTKPQAASYIADIFRRGKPHVVGAVPNFDTERIARFIDEQQRGAKPGWHYHLIDVENLMVGYLARQTQERVAGGGCLGGWAELLTPPWRSDDLALQLGIKIADEDRHTAMGDARWAMAIYDAVMGGAT